MSERRERLLVTLILNRPELLARVEEEFAALDMASRELDGLRRAILDLSVRESGLDSAALKNHLSTLGFSLAVERLSAPREWSERHLDDRFTRPDVALSEMEKGWRHVLSRHGQAVSLKAELRAAEEDLGKDMTEENLARFNALRRQMELGSRDDAWLDDPSPEGTHAAETAAPNAG